MRKQPVLLRLGCKESSEEENAEVDHANRLRRDVFEVARGA